MEQLNIALVAIGVTVVAIGLLSNVLKKSLFQEPLVAVLIGVAIGPYALGWLDMNKWGDANTLLEQGARLTLAVSLMGVALRLETDSIKILWRPVALLLTVGMVGMWFISSALAGWMLALPLWTALLLGAVVTPTDPVVANSVVTGRFAKEKLPLRLRDTISFESGANDGLNYVLVMLPVLMLTHAPGEAWSKWLVESVVIGVGGGMIIGVVMGWGSAALLARAVHHKIIEETSFLSLAIALALATLGLAEYLKTDALFAVFVAGVAFNLRIGDEEKSQKEPVQEAIAKLFQLPMFAVFGIALPLSDWARLGWPLLLLAILVVLLRRPPVWALLYPGLRRWLPSRDVAFIGWFGPIGIASIYYAAYAHTHAHDPLIWHAGSAVIAASVLAHGITAAPFTNIFARYRPPSPPASRPLDQKEEEQKEEQRKKDKKQEEHDQGAN